MMNIVVYLKHVEEVDTMRQFKVLVEKHPDGYVAYPLGLKGVIVAQGNSYEEVLREIQSAIAFHIQTFGQDAFEQDTDIVEAFVAEASV